MGEVMEARGQSIMGDTILPKKHVLLILMCVFWLTTECRSRAYAIMICLSSSLSSLLSVSTPPDHMLGQIRFILCMHMQLYPV